MKQLPCTKQYVKEERLKTIITMTKTRKIISKLESQRVNDTFNEY